ncbi:amino acid ABC transporter substrate-binding protein (PAAT family) [Plasticicumulans lactativorans]|uniref:Amino acid ABC transporter substrate-binding protein (PAAT family) n=2 Tax=Plasticicumulans lactativorans TaxID=1133106 RepID=A0A4R2KU81_9GAMM|nr:amino acid ABC transporter substrate-binding protein (PAAT family) [Plasticicumulans lactativorans]
MRIPSVNLAVGCLLLLCSGMASAQGVEGELTGTLKKAYDSGTVAIGYRESSLPFSYLDKHGEPIGYSIDLCRAIVDAISDDIGKELTIKWVPVTPDNRIEAVTSGQIDLECGSTTSNVERQKVVAFSPIIFVSGTKLMVRKGSPIRSFRDLKGKKVVVTAGTTNEKAINQLSERFKLGLNVIAAKDHAESYALLAAGQADAFATDEVLLYGLIATNKAENAFMVVGDFLSYDPYGLMFRKNDPPLADLVRSTLVGMAESRELVHTYTQWFRRRLPSGERLNLPMSAQLEDIIGTMSTKPE